MTEIFLKLSDQLNSSVFVLMALLVATGYGLLKIGGRAERFAHLNQKIDGALSMEKTVIRLEQLTELIYNNTLKTPLVKSFSPILLTRVGMEASESIGFELLLKREFSKLANLVEEMSPKNAYDIQVASMRVSSEQFLKVLNVTELLSAKEYAYSKGLRLEDLSSVLGVLLRNEILKNKGISVAKVDD
jgi:hypothetical protein